MIDTGQLMWEFLTVEGTGLYTLCGTRVWSPHLPGNFTNTAAAVTYHQEAETQSGQNTGVITTGFVFKCYGGDKKPSAARTVYRALHDRLNMGYASVTEGAIILAIQTTALQMPPDPDTGWPAFVAKYEVTVE